MRLMTTPKLKDIEWVAVFMIVARCDERMECKAFRPMP